MSLLRHLTRLIDSAKRFLPMQSSDSQSDAPKLEFPAKFPYYVEVLADLPYYVQLPENVMLKPSRIGAESFYVELEPFVPKRHPDESQGENVDDRMGTYVRSRARVLFPLTEDPGEPDWPSYEEKSLSIVNRLIESVRYLAFDHTTRRVMAFDRTVFRTWKLYDDGTAEPIGVWQEKHSYGPFGIRPLGWLSDAKLQDLWWHFNGLAPTNPAWHLVLDAKFHNETGDIPRAILDLATALEINVPSLIEHYSSGRPEFRQLDIDSAGIYSLYDEILQEATGHSLHGEPDMFANLEYIRAMRNSIAHDWKAVFKISSQMQNASQYMHVHAPRDGHELDSHDEVQELVEQTIEIIKHTIQLFEKYPSP